MKGLAFMSHPAPKAGCFFFIKKPPREGAAGYPKANGYGLLCSARDDTASTG